MAKEQEEKNTMNGSLTPSFVLLGSALIIWSTAAMLSSYLSEDFSRQHGVRQGSAQSATAASAGGPQGQQSADGAAEGPVDIAALRKEVDANPKNADLKVKLGYELVQLAQTQKDSSSLMEAVQILSQALQINPEHRQALLGLATLTLQAGVVDKALDLYPRYLKLEPTDDRARTDYALALIEARRYPDAEKELMQVLAKDPASIPANMTFAYRFKTEGRMADAKARAQEALVSAQDPETRKGIQSFITSLDAPGAPSGASATAGTSETSAATAPAAGADSPHAAQIPAPEAAGDRGDQALTSPASRISTYFKTHPIIGPKLKGIRWEGATTAVVKLDNFPVEQMPPFAKAQFVQRITDTFTDLPEATTIKLVDADSEKELMTLQVGPK